MSYLRIEAQDLNIGDLVRGRGRVARTPDDHDTRPGFVVVIFERRSGEKLEILRAKAKLDVKCDDGDKSN